MHIIYFRADPHCPITFINKRQISCICQMIVKLSGLKKKWRINVKSAEEGTIVSLPLCSSPTHRSNSTQKFSFEQKQKHVSLSSVCCTNFNPSQLIRVKYHLWVISKKKKKILPCLFLPFLVTTNNFHFPGSNFPHLQEELSLTFKNLHASGSHKKKSVLSIVEVGWVGQGDCEFQFLATSVKAWYVKPSFPESQLQASFPHHQYWHHTLKKWSLRQKETSFSWVHLFISCLVDHQFLH